MLTDQKRICSIWYYTCLNNFYYSVVWKYLRSLSVCCALWFTRPKDRWKTCTIYARGISPNQFILGTRKKNNVLKTSNLLFLNGKYHLREGGSLFSFAGSTTSTGFRCPSSGLLQLSAVVTGYGNHARLIVWYVFKKKVFITIFWPCTSSSIGLTFRGLALKVKDP